MYFKLLFAVCFFAIALFEVGSWLIIEYPGHWSTSLFFRAYIIALLFTTCSFLKRGDRSGLKRQDKNNRANAREPTP